MSATFNSPLDRPFLHSRTARLGASADRRQRPDRRDDAVAGAPRRVPRPGRRAAGLGLFRRHAGRNPGRARDHPARRPHPRLRRLRFAGGRLRRSHACVPWPIAWLIFRALLGFVFAGLYAVIEAWINAKATNANRGALYALYQIANFSASATGQMALQPLGPGRPLGLRRRGGAPGARDRSDGDDQR